MKIEIGSYETKTKLPELLRQAKPVKASLLPIVGNLLPIWYPAQV